MILVRLRSAAAREWPILLLLALFGVIYSSTLTSYGMFMWDEAEYACMARSLVHGEGFAISAVPKAERPPMLPLAGAAAMLLTGQQFEDFVLRAVSVCFALLALLCVYAFIAMMSNRTTGVIAAACLGMFPFFWIFVPYFMCEIPFMTFFAAAVWFFYLGAYRHQRFFVFSWISFALALLTRYTAVLFVPLAALFALLALWKGGPETRRRFRSRAFFLGPLAGLALVLPWLTRQYLTFGTPLAGLDWVSQQLQVYMPGVSMPWSFYLRQIPAMVSPGIAVLLAAGVIWAFWARDRFTLFNVLAAGLIYTWFSCYRYKEDRLVSSALPFMAAIVAVSLHAATAKIRPRARYWVLGVILGAFLVLNYRTTQPIFEKAFTFGYPSFLDAMDHLRLAAAPGDVVLGANYPQINWYSGLRAIDFPAESDLPAALKRANWVVVTNFERGQKPYVTELANRFISTHPQSVEEFRDRQFITVVIRADQLLPALAE